MCGDQYLRRLGAWLLNLILPAAIALPSAAAAQGDWCTRFRQPGADSAVYATIIFDGDLVIGGDFRLVDDCFASRIARFDGTRWVPMGAGFDDRVLCLYVLNGELYAGGDFDSSGTMAVNHVARWDGETWQPLGGGVTGEDATVTTFLGHRQQLLVGGYFSAAGGDKCGSIARWDGSAWHGFSATSGFRYSGGPGGVRELLEFNGQPVAVGGFDEVDGQGARNAARWNGTRWVAMGALGDHSGRAGSALVFQGRLLATSSFRIWVWTGDAWTLLSNWQLNSVWDMIEYDGDLIIAGRLPAQNHIARWDGYSWHQLGGGLWGPYWDEGDERAHSLCVYNDLLVVGSSCKLAGELCTPYLAAWNGAQWVAPTDPDGSGDYKAMDYPPTVLAEYEGNLLAGGAFHIAYATPLHGIGVWDGTAWSPVGGGFPHYYHVIDDLCEFDGELIAAGILASYEVVARWDGQSWEEMGDDPLTYSVFALHVHNGVLYAGGSFTEDEDEYFLPRIARWQGNHWGGLWWRLDPYGLNDTVYDLESYRGDLIAAGSFTEAGGSPANRIARWDGQAWHALGMGVNGDVFHAQTIGDSLFVAGTFTEAGGQVANYIALWDGQVWSPIAEEPDNRVSAITQYHGDLVIGGRFSRVGSEPAACIARWDGETWKEIGGGLRYLLWSQGWVYELEVVGDRLYVSGHFDLAGRQPSCYLACWEENADGTRGHWVSVSPTLEQNYPNPFNPSTRIPFSLTAGGSVRLEIFDTSGRHVRTLLDGELPAGEHLLEWDGRDAQGGLVAAGVYFSKLSAGGQQLSQKMLLLN